MLSCWSVCYTHCSSMDELHDAQDNYSRNTNSESVASLLIGTVVT